MKNLAMLLLLPACICAAQSPRTPTVYAISMSVDSGSGKPMEMALRTLSNGSVQRIEVHQAYSPVPGMDGMYQLIFPKSDSVIAVMPSRNMTIINNSPAETLRLLGGIKVAVKDATANVEPLGAGPVMFGLQTQRYRLTQHTVVEASLGGDACTKTSDSISEVTYAPGYANLESGMMPNQMSPGVELGTGAEASEKLAEIRKKVPVGLILQSDTKSGAVKTSIVVKELSFDPQESSLFTPPFGNQITDTRQMMKDNAAAMAPMVQMGFKKSFCGT